MALKRTAMPALFRATISYDYTGVNASVARKVSLTVPGSTPDMFYKVECKGLTTNIAMGQAYCSTAGTVVVELINPTAGNLGSGGAQTFEIWGF